MALPCIAVSGPTDGGQALDGAMREFGRIRLGRVHLCERRRRIPHQDRRCPQARRREARGRRRRDRRVSGPGSSGGGSGAGGLLGGGARRCDGPPERPRPRAVLPRRRRAAHSRRRLARGRLVRRRGRDVQHGRCRSRRWRDAGGARPGAPSGRGRVRVTVGGARLVSLLARGDRARGWRSASGRRRLQKRARRVRGGRRRGRHANDAGLVAAAVEAHAASWSPDERA